MVNCLSYLKEMLGFFRTRQGLQKFFGIPFTFLLLFRPLTLQLLRAFPLMWFNLIHYQCIVLRVWVSKERLLFVFTIWFKVYHKCLGLLSTLEVLFVQFLFVGGFLILLLYFLLHILIYYIVVSNIKKNPSFITVPLKLVHTCCAVPA